MSLSLGLYILIITANRNASISCYHKWHLQSLGRFPRHKYHGHPHFLLVVISNLSNPWRSSVWKEFFDKILWWQFSIGWTHLVVFDPLDVLPLLSAPVSIFIIPFWSASLPVSILFNSYFFWLVLKSSQFEHKRRALSTLFKISWIFPDAHLLGENCVIYR